ncbi:threonine/serine exporter ThrE family protein [Nocardioides sp. MH1]|uniref:threonine/serine ThrE exporter family protein n=1 Tax=Nocardioides sp. MH1 TaxID=3242490 RepID=UPI003521AFB6
MADARELTQRLDLCLRVGEMLLSSGAGAADVTATMSALASALGVRRTVVDVTFTQLAMSAQAEPDEPAIVQIRSVTQREIDYEDLTRTDHLVREVVSGRMELKEARAEIARIASSGHARPRWAATLGSGVSCAGIAIMLGGDALVTAVAFVAAVAIVRLQLAMSRRRLPFFYQQVAGGAVATVLAAVVTRSFESVVPVDASLVVTANIVMLLAGIGFMGAIQDALSGFYVTGGARILEAILATAGIIAGVSGGISLASAIRFQLPALEPARFDLTSVSVAAVGAGIAASAFAYASYAPKRILAPLGVLAAVAMAISQTIDLQDVGSPWATGLAAFVVGLVSYTIAGRMRVPPLVVVVPAVVPMLPGLSIYRGLALLGEAERGFVANGLLAMVTAASVAIALAAGVILGEYVAQPVKREARRVEGRLAGPRLVGVTRVRRRRHEAPPAD